ncbi:MAG: hypothetical protein F6J97_25690 [Leptolyngbya sp. SIO4C1]|nr:hypothetical protein [Leptolyngbya sp. SIO4C1]
MTQTTDSTAPEIYVIAEVEETEEVTTIDGVRDGRRDTGGGWGAPTRGPAEVVTKIFKRRRVSLDAKALQTQMQSMIAVVNDLFAQAQTSGGLELSEVELSVEINAEGQISLVGNGGKLGNSGGITLKFVRPGK